MRCSKLGVSVAGLVGWVAELGSLAKTRKPLDEIAAPW